MARALTLRCLVLGHVWHGVLTLFDSESRTRNLLQCDRCGVLAL